MPWLVPTRRPPMSQPTRRRISDQINSLRDAKALPFHDVLDATMVERALAEEGVGFTKCIYTPFVTLCLFLSQTLDPDHSCHAAVARLIVWRAIDGRKTGSPETGSYCEARERLPLKVIIRLVRQNGGCCWRGSGALASACIMVSFPHRFRFGEVGRAMQPIETKGEGILNPLIIFGDGRHLPRRIEGPEGKEVPLTREP